MPWMSDRIWDCCQNRDEDLRASQQWAVAAQQSRMHNSEKNVLSIDCNYFLHIARIVEEFKKPAYTVLLWCSEGGFFNATLSFPLDYPSSPPQCRFLSDMWHPNGGPPSLNRMYSLLKNTDFLCLSQVIILFTWVHIPNKNKTLGLCYFEAPWTGINNIACT